MIDFQQVRLSVSAVWRGRNSWSALSRELFNVESNSCPSLNLHHYWWDPIEVFRILGHTLRPDWAQIMWAKFCYPRVRLWLSLHSLRGNPNDIFKKKIDTEPHIQSSSSHISIIKENPPDNLDENNDMRRWKQTDWRLLLLVILRKCDTSVLAKLDNKWLTKELCWKVSSDKNLASSHTILDTRLFFNSDIIQVGQQQGEDKESWTVFCQWDGPSW